MRLPPPDWREHAECRDTDIPDAFHASPTTPRQWVAEAKQMCARCPVSELCLQTALNERLDFGMWGGMTEHERKQLRSRVRGTA